MESLKRDETAGPRLGPFVCRRSPSLIPIIVTPMSGGTKVSLAFRGGERGALKRLWRGSNEHEGGGGVGKGGRCRCARKLGRGREGGRKRGRKEEREMERGEAKAHERRQRKLCSCSCVLCAFVSVTGSRGGKRRYRGLLSLYTEVKNMRERELLAPTDRVAVPTENTKYGLYKTQVSNQSEQSLLHHKRKLLY